MPRAILFASLFIAAQVHSTGAGAQNIYRCQDGYRQQPCAGGAALPDDARSAEQKAQADAATRRDARTADAMEKDRRKQEARSAPAHIPQPQAPAEGSARPAKAKKPETFSAIVPGSQDKAKDKKRAKKEG